MSNARCDECKDVIEGEVIWYRPFTPALLPDPSAGVPETPAELPFHPDCFDRRTRRTRPVVA